VCSTNPTSGPHVSLGQQRAAQADGIREILHGSKERPQLSAMTYCHDGVRRARLVRIAPISHMQAARFGRRHIARLQAQGRLVQGTGVALPECFVEPKGFTRLPTATRIDPGRSPTSRPGAYRRTARRAGLSASCQSTNHHAMNGDQC
jgi:hypothetical protein